jgi:Ca2+-binding EF-hand superfamily protein
MKRPGLTRLAALCVVALGSAHALADTPTPAAAADYRMMHHDHWCGWPGTGSADQDFALRLRRHDTMLLDMARDELAHGTDPQLRALAQHVVDTQGSEVTTLESWLTGQHVDYLHVPMGMDWRMRFDAMDRDHDGQIEASEIDASHPWHEHFALADANHDGVVTRAEMEAYRPPMRPFARFEDIDANHDGTISRAELDAYRPMHGGMRFEAMDRNHDGMLDAGEVAADARWHDRFAMADTNHDGKVSRDEADEAREAMRDRDHDRDHDGDVDEMDCASAMEHHDGDAHSAPMPPDFAGMDKNGDGFLTAAELPQSDWMRDHFTAFDADGNGRISREEFEAHHEIMDSMRH